MERFAIKIDKTLKSNLYKLCRLCGIDNPSKVQILDKHQIVLDDGEVDLWRKIVDCIGIQVKKDDKMPQSICTLCIDKVNDFHEFREMCYATNMQTRKLLGLKDLPPETKKEPKVEETELELKVNIPSLELLSPKSGRGRKRKNHTEAMSAVSAKQIKTDVPGPSKVVIKPTLAFLKKQKLKEIEQQIKDEKEITVTEKKEKNQFKEKCTICPQGFQNTSLLEKHLIDKHCPDVVRYHCAYCDESLKKNSEIKDHNLWHKLSRTPYSCAHCSSKMSSMYLLTKHLKECGAITVKVKVDPLPDISCNKCNDIFQTNFLFNIHPCALSKKCAGCSKTFRTKEDTLKHLPKCSQATKRVARELVLLPEVKSEPTVDVRPVIPDMNPNQFVVIPPNVNISDSPTVKNKKTNRITKKDLKRYDELLKSTMTTFVSIKQEPIHDDDPDSLSASQDHHADMDDDDSNEACFIPIKQEIIDEGYRDLDNNIEVNIKKEIVITREPSVDASKTPAEDEPDLRTVPVLKLKIKKEHGTLVPLLIDGKERKKEKKKKKKKLRKSLPTPEDVRMPMPGVIQIKQETIEENEDNCGIAVEQGPTLQISSIECGVSFPNSQKDIQPQITLIERCTNSPKPQDDIQKLPQISEVMGATCSTETLRISAVSSGVLFPTNPVCVKKEIVDPSYDEGDYTHELEFPQMEQVPEEAVLEPIAEEQEFIRNIDFNNLSIKQEIDVAAETFGDELPTSESEDEDFEEYDDGEGSQAMSSEADEAHTEKDSGVVSNISSIDVRSASTEEDMLEGYEEDVSGYVRNDKLTLSTIDDLTLPASGKGSNPFSSVKGANTPTSNDEDEHRQFACETTSSITVPCITAEHVFSLSLLQISSSISLHEIASSLETSHNVDSSETSNKASYEELAGEPTAATIAVTEEADLLSTTTQGHEGAFVGEPKSVTQDNEFLSPVGECQSNSLPFLISVPYSLSSNGNNCLNVDNIVGEVSNTELQRSDLHIGSSSSLIDTSRSELGSMAAPNDVLQSTVKSDSATGVDSMVKRHEITDENIDTVLNLEQNPNSSDLGSNSLNSIDDLKPVLSEEVENLLNEDEEAVSIVTMPSTSAGNYLNNFEDINEIAENHNNANIEKELLDELSPA